MGAWHWNFDCFGLPGSQHYRYFDFCHHSRLGAGADFGVFSKEKNTKALVVDYYLYFICRGVREMPPPGEGAFNENGKLRRVKLLPDRQIQVLDEYIEGPLLNI